MNQKSSLREVPQFVSGVLTPYNQHCVPKFILRQFLADTDGERVAVYDKQTDKMFVTSIRNVRAENRFNDFLFDDDWIVTFEPLAFAVEDQVLPTYKKILETRRLDNSPQRKRPLPSSLHFSGMCKFGRIGNLRQRTLSSAIIF